MKAKKPLVKNEEPKTHEKAALPVDCNLRPDRYCRGRHSQHDPLSNQAFPDTNRYQPGVLPHTV